MQEIVYCRMAPSLGALEGRPEDVWGTKDYEGDSEKPTVFMGLYGLPDFYTLWRHKGKKWIFWCGSDIRHFVAGYWLDEVGSVRIGHRPLARWIKENCESWVENEVERQALEDMGIPANVCPSFLGNVEDYDISYEHSLFPSVYTSVSGDNYELYGWHLIPELARENPHVVFHLYGNTKPAIDYFGSLEKNIVDHGRVPKERMNEEIRKMQGALRLTTFDGFSEILAKSVLWGQWPVSLIEYPYMLSLDKIGSLKEKESPNEEGREHYKRIINKFPWLCQR